MTDDLTDDFSLFKADDGGDPPDGTHTAWLVKAAILDTRNGTRIKCEWQTEDLAFWWESWHGVSGGAKQFTRQMLRGLGINLDTIGSWDELGDELAVLERGTLYDVVVARKGDFVNTTVTGRSQGVQTDLPIDTDGLPEVSPDAQAVRQTAGMFDDDDPPF